MPENSDHIESGILEQYLLGLTNEEESREVELLASTDPAVKQELDAISRALETFARNHAVEPDPIIKPFLLATIDYTERLKNGEPPADPPILHENSTAGDYQQWLSRADMVCRDTDQVFAKIIGYTPQAITAIVWLKDYAPQEVHDHEYERFLIVEGTCNIMVEDKENHLGPGDYFAIPLHKSHTVKVTSSIPCKIVLQRVAA